MSRHPDSMDRQELSRELIDLRSRHRQAVEALRAHQLADTYETEKQLTLAADARASAARLTRAALAESPAPAALEGE